MGTKMDLRKVFLAILIAVLFSSSAAFAVTVNFTGLPPNIDSVNSKYVGFATGDNPFGYIAHDYAFDIYVPGSYNAVVSSFGDGLAKAKFRYDADLPMTREYKEAAWLMYRMKEKPLETAAIQYAIWNIFTPGAPNYPGQNPWILAAQNQADHGFADFNFNDVRVYTFTIGGVQLEVMSAVPLPSALWLFGAGLAGLVAMRRRLALKEEKEAKYV